VSRPAGGKGGRSSASVKRPVPTSRPRAIDKPTRETSIAADPTQWSRQSQQSVAAHFKREYVDIAYACWHCRAACVFTAHDQKQAFEVRKASIDQRRMLCADCWSESHRTRAALAECDRRWASAKAALQRDAFFLQQWLELLIVLERYVAYKPDTARKNMLRKLLASTP
jgi:hypothetical protein